MNILIKISFVSCLLTLALVQTLHAETLLNHTSKGIGIRVDQSNSTLDVSITGTSYKQSSTFKLKSPTRIVVDLEGNFPKISKSFALHGDPEFKEIRLGTHPGKLRIVLELNSTRVPNFTSSDTTNSFVLSTNRLTRGNTLAAKEKLQPLPRFPTTSNELPSGPSALSALGVANVNTNLQEPETPRAMIKPQVEHKNSGKIKTNQRGLAQETDGLIGPSLIDLSFIEPTSDDDLGALQISLTERDAFTLIRTNQKEYKLLLAKTTETGLEIDLPYFPPQKLRGITVVTPTKEKTKLAITIGTDRGFRLRATSSGRNIIIRPSISKWAN